YPKDYWPNLQLIGCWKGGTLSLYLDSFKDFFREDIPIRDLGLIASEGRFSIPLFDSGSEGVLDISSNFYEFIPESEIDSKKPTVLTASEIEKGKYFIIPTTSSGLYRYNIMDLIEVTGFYNQTPIISFLNKGSNISSLTGEKITEHQAIKAMEKTCRQNNLLIDTFILSPAWGDYPYYVLALEKKDTIIQIEQIAEDFDKALRELNIEYDSKRKDRLDKLIIGIVPSGTFDGIREDAIKRLGRDAQYKHQFVNPEIDYHRKLGAKLID
ncbi:MAG: GH3 auxin-responsive promoter family protein, partial [Nanoarchaeota archaeon]